MPWARTRGSHGRFTPKKQRDHKDEVAWLAKAENPSPFDGPVQLDVTFTYKRPKRGKYDTPQVKPDIDNLVKQVMDALNGVWWDDDAQVVDLSARKVYGGEDDTTLHVRPLVC